MKLLADLLSSSPARVHAASITLRQLRDLPRLRQLALHLEDLRSRLSIDTQEALAFAVRKLEHVRKNRECLCTFYLSDDLFNPLDEARLGHIHILQTVRVDRFTIDHHMCECAQCGAQYQVEENNYDHLWWAWRKTRSAHHVFEAPTPRLIAQAA